MTGRWRNRYFTATLRAAGGLTTTPALSAAALSVTVPALSRVTLELPLPLLDSGMAQDCPPLLVSVAMPGGQCQGTGWIYGENVVSCPAETHAVLQYQVSVVRTRRRRRAADRDRVAR